MIDRVNRSIYAHTMTKVCRACRFSMSWRWGTTVSCRHERPAVIIYRYRYRYGLRTYNACAHGVTQARKISDIPFPFPHAQLSNMILVLFSVTLPFVLACAYTPQAEEKTELNAMIAGALAMVCSVTFFALSEVARDLEGICLCVRVCVRVRSRAYVRACVRACVPMLVGSVSHTRCVCVCMCLWVCVRAYARRSLHPFPERASAGLPPR